MKLYKYSLALMLGIGALTSCSDKLELTNPNQSTTGTFGYTADDLDEAVIACYHHIRMEGTYARVGYTHDLVRGDEVWNPSIPQNWYLPIDNLNAPSTNEVACLWIWRDWYYAVNISNFVITRCEEKGDNAQLSDRMQRIKGQALFIRGLAYYNLACYYQNPALILDYNQYSDLNGLYASNDNEDPNAQFDLVMDQVEKDLAEAMTLLPSRDEGGEWAKGRATSGAAAGFYARALMQRQKYSDALAVLKDIIGKKYGTYELTANYGDNFREGAAYENNKESLFEVQFLDYGSQGPDDEWTPVNISKTASQGHAVESNFGPGSFGGWADLSAAPWLYELFKAERTTDGKLDPRLYWTICTYEPEWEGFEFGNVCYGTPMQPGTDNEFIITNNDNGGLPIAKYTNMREGLYDKVVTGLKCGINLRLMRYSDVLLRAAECENELSGPTQQAFDWINQVRSRAKLAALKKDDFTTKEQLFEQIANVERPKEFGCEYGRGFDLLRWGFFYDSNRLQQLKQHGAYNIFTKEKEAAKKAAIEAGLSNDDVNKAVLQVLKDNVKTKVTYGVDGAVSTYDYYKEGHEFLPIFQNVLNVNPNLKGNSANYDSSNKSYYSKFVK